MSGLRCSYQKMSTTVWGGASRNRLGLRRSLYSRASSSCRIIRVPVGALQDLKFHQFLIYSVKIVFLQS